ncbi:MAG: hypothetical protein RJB66_694 [Pseudomonadota bacterium]|jgi:hypothetical protein
MKKLIICFMLMTGTAHAHSFLDCKKGDTEVAARAATLLVDVEDMARKGFINRSELLRARLFQFEAEHCSGKITTSQFCEVAMPLLRDWNALEDTGLGNTAPADRKEKITLLARGKILCE